MSLNRRQGSISSGQKRRRKTEQYRARKQAVGLSDSRLLTRAVLFPQSIAWRGRRAFMRRLAELHNPDTGVDVIEKDVIAELSGAPGERQVWTEPLRVAGP